MLDTFDGCKIDRQFWTCINSCRSGFCEGSNPPPPPPPQAGNLTVGFDNVPPTTPAPTPAPAPTTSASAPSAGMHLQRNMRRTHCTSCLYSKDSRMTYPIIWINVPTDGRLFQQMADSTNRLHWVIGMYECPPIAMAEQKQELLWSANECMTLM